MQFYWKYIGELPSGYEYKIVQQTNYFQILGVSENKSPIMFALFPDGSFHEVDIEETSE